MFTLKEYKKFKILLKPYSENGRTVNKQIIWLGERYFFRDEIIIEALKSVYKELEKGKKFEDGHFLDRHILDRCNELKEKGIVANIITDVGWWRNLWNNLNKPRGYLK